LRKEDAGDTATELKYSPPVQKLVDEHKVIKRWLALIPKVLDDLDLSSDEGRQLIRDGLDLIRSFADKYHHAKEEDILFKYFDESLDILEVMHQDHESARAHVRAIAVAVEQGDETVVREHLEAYRELLQEHIKKEDEILYPWLDRQLSDAQIGRLFSQFREVDEKFGDTPRQHEKFVQDLEKRWEVVPESSK
jgi:hemerythrin-like domain-containing protein